MRIFRIPFFRRKPQKDRVWFRPAPGQIIVGTCIGTTESGSYLRIKVGDAILLADPVDCGPADVLS